VTKVRLQIANDSGEQLLLGGETLVILSSDYSCKESWTCQQRFATELGKFTGNVNKQKRYVMFTVTANELF
jgi:hypothetical protein